MPSEELSMQKRRRATITRAVLLAALGLGTSITSSSALAHQDNVLQAHVALTYDAARRCPDLRTATAGDPAVTVVLFKVGPSGVPSEPSIRSSSGSSALDAAAMSCVTRLRFQPATSFGDGAPTSSWQQMAWKWSNPQAHHDPAAAQALPAPTAAGIQASASGAGSAAAPAAALTAAGTAVAATTATAPAAAPKPAAADSAAAASTAGEADVHVCVDASGKLAHEPTISHSSGDAGFDQAAIKIARSGSGYYRPPLLDGRPAPGCMQLTIRPEKR
jgi:TonB family protein